MDCDCVRRFRSMGEDKRLKAGSILEVHLPKRLEAFAEAMRLGTLQLVARHLLRAGVFRASLDLGGSRNVSVDSMIGAVRRVVAVRPRLQDFLSRYEDIVAKQAVYVDPENILPKRFRNREHLNETFGGYIRTSLDAAEKFLDQLETLEKRLPVWKSFARGADVPRVELIMDYHDSLK